jgi:hypothetical protein
VEHFMAGNAAGCCDSGTVHPQACGACYEISVPLGVGRKAVDASTSFTNMHGCATSLFEQSVFDDPLVKVDPCVKTEMIAI